MQLFIIVYFVGMYWFVFVDVVEDIIHLSLPGEISEHNLENHSPDTELDDFMNEFGLTELNGFEKT